MTVNCVWEHNGNDTLLHAVDYIGAYSRGENLDTAITKMPKEVVLTSTGSVVVLMIIFK